MAGLRVIDVKVVCMSLDGGGLFPGYDPLTVLMPPQPQVKIILKTCEEQTYSPEKKIKIADTFKSESIPLFMLYGIDVPVTSMKNSAYKELLSSFGPKVLELVHMRAELVFAREPIKQVSYLTCPACSAILHSNSPVDFARHTISNGTCNRPWMAAVENEQLRVMNMRLQQRCDYLVTVIQSSYANMCVAIKDIGHI